MGTNANAEHFFEGAEKLLEIWFTCDEQVVETQSLRTIPRWQWDKLLEYARCQICSVTSNDFMDAYVLSESSMFVTDDRFILKTCGSTSLMHTLKPLLELAERYCGLNKVQNIFYTRKNFIHPELQPEPHASFDEEASYLDELFEDGAAYCLGRVNHDRWYLWTLNSTAVSPCMKFPDQTLEILMSDLDQEVMGIFSTNVCTTGVEATKLAAIDKLLPRGTLIDDKLFDPHGYSMNAILPDSDEYATIHITPEEKFSYCSFETNIKQGCQLDQIKRVIYCFRPGKFIVALFANKESRNGIEGQKDIWEKSLAGYKRTDTQFLILPDYIVTYSHYVRV